MMLTLLGCASPERDDVVPTPVLTVMEVESMLVAGYVTGVRAPLDAMQVLGCGGAADVDPRSFAWAMRVDRTALPCDVEFVVGGRYGQSAPIQVTESSHSVVLAVKRPSLGVVVDGSFNIVATPLGGPLNAGDKILSINGNQDVRVALAGTQAGDTVTVDTLDGEVRVMVRWAWDYADHTMVSLVAGTPQIERVRPAGLNQFVF